MNKEVVIALYDKDISWIKDIDNSIKITVYLKGNKVKNNDAIYIENNIGRDVHTFFNHIYTNYDNLADYTFFVQDYPFDHWENCVQIINSNESFMKANCAIEFNGYYGFHYNSIKIPCDRGGIMWQLYPSNQLGHGNILKCNNRGRPQDLNDNIDLDKYWSELFTEQCPVEYEFIPGGHFCITRDAAQYRSKHFYKKIIELLENNINMPWIIERLECYIFNKRFNTKV